MPWITSDLIGFSLGYVGIGVFDTQFWRYMVKLTSSGFLVVKRQKLQFVHFLTIVNKLLLIILTLGYYQVIVIFLFFKIY